MKTLSCAVVWGLGDLALPLMTSLSVTCQTVAVVRSTDPDLDAVAEAVQPPLTRACPATGATRRLISTISHAQDARTTIVRRFLFTFL
jgi:hypothetical protein